MSMPWLLAFWQDMLEAEIPASFWAVRQKFDDGAKNNISHSAAPAYLYGHNSKSKHHYF